MSNFYRRVEEKITGSNNRPGLCKAKEGNTVVETQLLVGIWRDHFNQLLNGDEVHNPAYEQPGQVHLVADLECHPLSLDEVNIAIT